jgi:hypothetical protein
VSQASVAPLEITGVILSLPKGPQGSLVAARRCWSSMILGLVVAWSPLSRVTVHEFKASGGLGVFDTSYPKPIVRAGLVVRLPRWPMPH